MLKFLFSYILFATNLFASDSILNKSLIEIDGKTITIIFIVQFFMILLIGLIIAWLYRHKIAKSELFK